MKGLEHYGDWNLFGVEVNEYAANLAREQGLDVRLGTLEQAHFPNDFFDVVTLWDVLEHLHDPAGCLQEIARILKPDGLLVIRVPNASGLAARMFGRYWAGFDAPRHLYVFTPATLAKLLALNHFECVTQDTRLGAYSGFQTSLRFWSGARDKSNPLLDFAVKNLNHPFVRLILFPLFFLLSLGLRGPSLVTLARKNAGET